ncbi:putative ABC transporter permease [Caviibacter abscessus]|uniref:putative ABC transporter permease n=1 Tax=Caviibacter abscessus TaxID=1766719 RepID=UPI00082FD962|nr:putative ABC transporter permease [Caviibacter abscessus]
MFEYIWYFIIYSFLGWCIEVIYQALTHKKFINRGFLNGAYCPIYGFGAVFVIYLLKGTVNNPIILYALAVVITSIIEYITGFVLKKIFGLLWWDYTNEHFNLSGYICLKFSLLWGIAALILMYVIHPKTIFLVNFFNNKIGNILLIMLILVVFFDFLISILKLFSLKKDRKKLEKLSKKFRVVSDEIGKNLADITIQYEKKYKRLMKSYPKLKDIFKNFK